MEAAITPEQWLRVKDIVGSALDCKEGDQQAFLDAACAGDEALRLEVDSLIAAYYASDSLSFHGLGEAFGVVPETPRTIGPYRLERELGAGGMGQVWLAEQTEPVHRHVALKLIRAGLYDKHVAQRFFAERQSLALMSHPAIAKIFDAGTTPAGQPYLVMEYVDGCPITEYCDTHKLAIVERLKLFQLVCDGVQHAHQKAIIHRDLKPSNILVTEIDGRPVPRIIDFGVAKGVTRGVGVKTLFTQVGSLIGTLGYMSPEQSEFSGEDIDTRSDVYSLGVVLYELLVGALPFDVKKLDSYASLHRLRESEAQRPSRRLKSLGEACTVSAHSRGTEVLPLVRQLQGDLDAITLKALEKDRRRRYATPSDLAADINNYLCNAPVTAHAPSLGYRARKYVRRHRLGATLAGTGLALLVGFVAFQSIQVRNIRQERDRADRITDFMTNIFKVSDPSEARGNTVTAREILDKSSREIEAGRGLDATVQSQLMDVMAETYMGLGLYSRARGLAERAFESRRQALGPDDPKTLESMKLLATVLFHDGRDADAEALFRRTVEAQTRVLGPRSAPTLETRNELAVTLIREAHHAEAEKIERDVITKEWATVGRENILTLRSMNTLASALRGESRFDEAEKMFRQLLIIEQRVLGADLPFTLTTMHSLANMLSEQGRYTEAEAMYRETLAIQRRILGTDHPETASTLTTLANTVARSVNRMPEAEAMYRDAIAVQLRVVGPDHIFTTRAQEGLANVLLDEHRYAEAEPLFRDILKTRQRVLGSDHTDVLVTQYNLADVLIGEKRFSDAEQLMRKTLEQQTRVLDANDPDTLASRTLLASILIKEGRPQQAVDLAKQSLDVQLRVLGPQHHDTQETLLQLGEALSHLGHYAQAQSLYLRTINEIEAQPKGDPAVAWYNIACIAADAGHTGDAFDYLARAVRTGYADAASLGREDDLKSLRGDPRFAAIVAGVRAHADQTKHLL